jgi:hypothetical protein
LQFKTKRVMARRYVSAYGFGLSLNAASQERGEEAPSHFVKRNSQRFIMQISRRKSRIRSSRVCKLKFSQDLRGHAGDTAGRKREIRLGLPRRCSFAHLRRFFTNRTRSSVLVRHEQAAVHAIVVMPCDGRVGVALVTSRPGVTDMFGIATAAMDSIRW